ncbi:MAG: nucleotidyltransferase family protein [Clostridiales bacterium]|nr:nucleotidyltransferase family protein [Clostridiales bacterium]MDY3746777.1 nucleotidyltransferase family protein [Lachnospiraceae bacterium]
MRVLGVIAEYNPFHNGHKFQLSECMKASDADYTVVVLGGDFTQRGTPALLNKYTRTAMALSGGADLVVELPQFASCASASYFAASGVSILKHLGIVTHLGFGSESGDIRSLMRTSEILTDETPELSDHIQRLLKTGYSYAAARDIALSALFEKTVNSPNDILAVEYIRAINNQRCHLIPVTVKRTGMAYHGSNLKNIESGLLPSATAIRNEILKHAENELYDPQKLALSLRDAMPASAVDLMIRHLNNCMPVLAKDFYPLLRYSLLTCDKLSYIFDISEDFANRLLTYKSCYGNLDSWISDIKSKNYTWTKVSRSLTHIMLRQTKDDACLMAEMDNAPYIRILGFKKSSGPLLKAIKNNCDIPVLTKMADAEKILNHKAYKLFQKGVLAARIYKSVEQTKAKHTIRDEYCESPVIFD